MNHGLVRLAGDWTGKARQIACPVLVLHGDRDPILPLPNGQAIAGMIPGARLTVLPGLGHALPAAFIPRIGGLIGDFLAEPSATPRAATPNERTHHA